MKTISLALVALLSTAQAVKLDADYRKSHQSRDSYDLDPNTVSPYDSMQQHKYLPKYDEEYGNEEAFNFQGVQTSSTVNKNKRSNDSYDGDSNTVSPYDAM